MRKISLNKILTLSIFIITSLIILHDIYFVCIQQWFNTTYYSWTIFGIITFTISLILNIKTFDVLKKYWNEVK